MRHTSDLKAVSDDDLIRGLSDILQRVRRDEADLIAHIAEVDARELYTREAVPSMFAYCTEILHLAENEAYFRITAARASREHPVLLGMLREGVLNLSAIALLARHLTGKNRDDVLKRAAGKSHLQLKELVAELAPEPDVDSSIRKLPRPRAVGPIPSGGPLGTFRVESAALMPGRPGPTPPVPATATSAPPRSAAVEPLAPARFKVQFTADQEMRDMLERLQALMRSSVPDGDLAAILKVAVAEKLERLEAKRFAKTKAPRKSLAQTETTPRSRHIPAAVRRTVHDRDRGRCTYEDAQGRRCSKRHDLEYHHRKPFARGGRHLPENLALVCRTHNALMAERDYGKEVMGPYRRSARSSPSAPPPLPVSRKRGHG